MSDEQAADEQTRAEQVPAEQVRDEQVPEEQLPDAQAAAPSGSLPRLSRRQTWALTLLLLAVSLIWIGVDWLNRAPPVEPQHTLSVADPAWQPLLALEDVTLLLPPLLVSDTLAFVGIQEERAEPSLRVLDVETGEARWYLDGLALTRPRGWPEEWPWRAPVSWRWSGLMAADGILYAVEAYLLETAVNAYNLTTGERLWHHKLGMINGSDADYTALTGGQIGVRINVPEFNAFYLMDQQAGTLLRTRRDDAALIFWIDDEPFRLYEANADTINVSEPAPWRVTVGGCGIRAQVTADMVLVRAEACSGPHRARVYALERETGRERWRYDFGAASNLAVDEDRVTFLTTAGDLVTLDVRTGQELAVLTFAPDVLAFAPPGGDAEETAVSFYVAAHDDLLAVYFGDSSQLFVYGRLEGR